MQTHLSHHRSAPRVDQGRWRLDRERSSIEFHVPNFYGLMTVKGRFADYDGSLELPDLRLTIEAASLDTGHAKRDRHLRSADFFAVEEHPHIRFTAGGVAADGDHLEVRGELEVAGERLPLGLDVAVRAVDGELEIEAVTSVDQRRLGMTWSPLGMVRAPSRLGIRGRLTR